MLFKSFYFVRNAHIIVSNNIAPKTNASSYVIKLSPQNNIPTNVLTNELDNSAFFIPSFNCSVTKTKNNAIRKKKPKPNTDAVFVL